MAGEDVDGYAWGVGGDGEVVVMIVKVVTEVTEVTVVTGVVGCVARNDNGSTPVCTSANMQWPDVTSSTAINDKKNKQANNNKERERARVKGGERG